jgi:hypothetical protein
MLTSAGAQASRTVATAGSQLQQQLSAVQLQWDVLNANLAGTSERLASADCQRQVCLQQTAVSKMAAEAGPGLGLELLHQHSEVADVNYKQVLADLSEQEAILRQQLARLKLAAQQLPRQVLAAEAAVTPAQGIYEPLAASSKAAAAGGQGRVAADQQDADADSWEPDTDKTVGEEVACLKLQLQRLASEHQQQQATTAQRLLQAETLSKQLQSDLSEANAAAKSHTQQQRQWVTEKSQLMQQLQEAKAELEGVKAQLGVTAAGGGTAEQGVRQLQAGLAATRGRFSSLGQQMEESTAAAQPAAVAALEEKVGQMQLELERSRSERQALLQEQASTSKQLASANQQVNDLQQQVQALQAQLLTSAAHTPAAGELQQLRELLFVTMQEGSAAMARVQQLRADVAASEGARSSLAQQLTAAQQQLQEAAPPQVQEIQQRLDRLADEQREALDLANQLNEAHIEVTAWQMTAHVAGRAIRADNVDAMNQRMAQQQTQLLAARQENENHRLEIRVLREQLAAAQALAATAAAAPAPAAAPAASAPAAAEAAGGGNQPVGRRLRSMEVTHRRLQLMRELWDKRQSLVITEEKITAAHNTMYAEAGYKKSLDKLRIREQHMLRQIDNLKSLVQGPLIMAAPAVPLMQPVPEPQPWQQEQQQPWQQQQQQQAVHPVQLPAEPNPWANMWHNQPPQPFQGRGEWQGPLGKF